MIARLGKTLIELNYQIFNIKHREKHQKNKPSRMSLCWCLTENISAWQIVQNSHLPLQFCDGQWGPGEGYVYIISKIVMRKCFWFLVWELSLLTWSIFSLPELGCSTQNHKRTWDIMKKVRQTKIWGPRVYNRDDLWLRRSQVRMWC